MEFKLIFQGPLLSARDNDPRLEHKHEIRQKIHRQLAELWKIHPAINRLSLVNIHTRDEATGTESHRSRLDNLADLYARRDFRFAPLINEQYSLVCSLDVLFLRRGEPGNVVHAGDIDNRIKTLLDALRIPTENELPSDAHPDETEKPFFCLLADDRLVTQLRVITDRLLVPEKEASEEIVQTVSGEKGSKHPASRVYLVISVRTMVSDPRLAYLEMVL